MTSRMTDEQYDNWLRSIEEEAATKEEADFSSPELADRQRVQVVLSNHMLYGAPNPEKLIQEALTHYNFDMSAPIERRPITDQDAWIFDGFLKEEDHDDSGSAYAAELIREYELRYGQDKVGGKISRSDLYEMLTRRGMLGTDTVPGSRYYLDSYGSSY